MPFRTNACGRTCHWELIQRCGTPRGRGFGWLDTGDVPEKLGLSGCEQLSMFVFYKKQTWDWFNQPELGLRQKTYGSYNQPTQHEGEKWSKGIWESICICSLFGCDVSYCVGIQQLFLCVDVSCVRVSGKDLVSIELYNSLPMSWLNGETRRSVVALAQGLVILPALAT